MAAFSTNTSPSGAAFVYHVVGALENAFEALVAWQERQETARVLSSLSNHQLTDIGIERSDIEAVSARRFR